MNTKNRGKQVTIVANKNGLSDLAKALQHAGSTDLVV